MKTQEYELVKVCIGMIGVVKHLIKTSANKEELEQYCSDTLKVKTTRFEDAFINVHDYPFYIIKEIKNQDEETPLILPKEFSLKYNECRNYGN